jgi:hypothetical protein
MNTVYFLVEAGRLAAVKAMLPDEVELVQVDLQPGERVWRFVVRSSAFPGDWMEMRELRPVVHQLDDGAYIEWGVGVELMKLKRGL